MHFCEKLENRIWSRVIRGFYPLYYLRLFKRIRKILTYDQTAVGLSASEQDEQALPGFERYVRSGYYRYMFGRYLYAIRYIHGKTVLDCGCGLGWGSYLLSRYASKVVSLDIHSGALSFARSVWNDESLCFLNHSVLQLEALHQQFGVVLAFELIEHLTQDQAAQFIHQVARVLHAHGYLILSSAFPRRRSQALKLEAKNPYHLHIFTRDEMHDLLTRSGFSRIRYLGELMIVARM